MDQPAAPGPESPVEPDNWGARVPGPASSAPPTCPSGWGRYSRGLAAAAWGVVGWGSGAPRVLTADAKDAGVHQGAHIGGAAETSHHGHVERGRIWAVGRPVPSRPQPKATHCTPSRFTPVLGRQLGHLHAVEGGHPVELQRGWWGRSRLAGEGGEPRQTLLGPGSLKLSSLLSCGVFKSRMRTLFMPPSVFTFPACKVEGTTMLRPRLWTCLLYLFIYLFGCITSFTRI